jgi:hypothetical protein
MNETSNIVLLAQAIEVEVETFLAMLKALKLSDGRARVVRHGHGLARTVQTGVGPGGGGTGEGTVGRPAMECGSSSARRSCRCGRGGPEVWMRCCRCST